MPEFSVSEISGAIKRTLEGSFGHVRVRGEVGRVLIARSGHVYFDLKDDRAVVSSVAWKGVAARFATMPEEGMEVVATGKVSTFGGQSKYQLIVERLEPAGVGALMAMLEIRKKALAAEGLFAPERKRPIPYLPEVIGVVTSPQGAVIRDILHRLRERFGRQVLLWPVTVQGERCAEQVARAIRGFNALPAGGKIPRPDVLIVARGGGSLEDLWGFNEEIVVRAAAQSAIPLISAVGHETDTTLIDHAADRRAPTPTAAAEMAVPVRSELLATVAGLQERRLRAMGRTVEARREKLRDLARALPRPAAILGERQQRHDAAAARLSTALTGMVQRRRLDLVQRTGRFGPALLSGLMARRRDQMDGLGGGLGSGLQRVVSRARDRLANRRLPVGSIRSQATKFRRDLAQLGTTLDTVMTRQIGGSQDRLAALERMRRTLGYAQTLARGYAVVRAAGSGAVLTRKAEAEEATGLEIEFRDGRLETGTAGARPAPGSGGGKPAKRRKPDTDGGGQGQLF